MSRFLYKYNLSHIYERLEYAALLLFAFYFWGSRRGELKTLEA